jgi:serine/threonine protein kinase
MAIGDETVRNINLISMTDPLLGQIVEQYKIESLLGTGAMGYVYRGVHQVIGKAAAIKVLKPDYADDPEMVQRLVREARTVNAIRHPAIVDIFGFGTLPRSEQPYIIMDLLEGQPLDVYIAEHSPMRPKDVTPMLDQLLSALEAAHKVGVIHRDLKPGNVFVESHPDGQKSIKVIDFGLAKQADRAGGSVRPTNPGTLLGTPAFMAPEQVLGTKVTPATDLYAVGGIAYQMLTNHLPHEAPSAIEVLSQKMQHDPIRPKQWQPTLDDELDGWVMNLLSREADRRFQDAEEARSRLRRISDGKTVAPGMGNLKPVSQSRTGVVPKRSWGDSKAVTEESHVEKSTDRFQEFRDEPKLRPSDETLVPTPSFAARGEIRTIAQAPEEVLAELHKKEISATLPPVRSLKESARALPSVPLASEEPKHSLAARAKPKTGLYLALVLSILALLGGLAWFLTLK